MPQLPPAEDSKLIERLRDSHTCREAFGDVVRLYSEPLYRTIRRLVPEHDDANDILQNTFLKAWGSLENFRGEARLSTWLYKIAINESISHLARERRRNHLSLDDQEAAIINTIASEAQSPDGDELVVMLRQAIAALPEKQRLVFNMRYYDEMKYEDISNILGTSVGALKASYHLAVKKIQKYFDHSN